MNASEEALFEASVLPPETSSVLSVFGCRHRSVAGYSVVCKRRRKGLQRTGRGAAEQRAPSTDHATRLTAGGAWRAAKRARRGHRRSAACEEALAGAQPQAAPKTDSQTDRQTERESQTHRNSNNTEPKKL